MLRGVLGYGMVWEEFKTYLLLFVITLSTGTDGNQITIDLRE
jgi:hypothetical protein